jgi:cytochrome c-type biogenesis protein CcmH/NrfG
MNKLKIFGIALFAFASATQAQDIDQAKKAMDAEQYEKAKTILKNSIKSNPDEGKANFLLGNIYLKANVIDSAKTAFTAGLSAKNDANFNYIGLGQIDLTNDKASDAKLKFENATKDVRRKDWEEFSYIGQAYTNAEKPDYKKAVEWLKKAKEVKNYGAEVELALGDAYFGDKNQNEAFVAYRAAYEADKNLIRAKMQSGVLLKNARAFSEAIKSYDEVISLNPNYGPVYRELAETYYLWANVTPRSYDEYIKKSLGFYEKYMTLTDYSLSSRMRRADFLILAKDFKALEVEANKMKQLDKVNPRILRYLGYSSYQNGNTDEAITALNAFISKGENKVIGRDYLYLGLAKAKKAFAADGETLDTVKFRSAIKDIQMAVQKDSTLAEELNAVGKEYFSKKKYAAAADIFEIAITNPNSKNYLEDNIYFGLCVYTENRGKKPEEMDKKSLLKGVAAMDKVIAKAPDYTESYVYKARLNSALENDEGTIDAYQKFLDIVTAKGAEGINQNLSKVTEAYNNIAAIYANTDKLKAKEFFKKTLAVDPTNNYALESLKILN